jgi:hypothetical protein
MKRILLFLATVGILASCSTPQKYAYHFGTHKYQSVDKKQAEEAVAEELAVVEMKAQAEDLNAKPQELVATTVPSENRAAVNPVLEKANRLADKYKSLPEAASKSEQRAIRKEMRHDVKDLKKDLKKYIKEGKDNPDSAAEAKALDKNLKISLILLVAAVLTTWIFWPLGVALWIAGLIFLIIWLAEQ